MSRPARFGGYTLYRIYYGDDIVYLGRTKQPLQDRIRGHLLKKPMHRAISADLLTKVECASFATEADMYLYEVYFINLWHPPLNVDDKATDDLTVTLPPVEWREFPLPLLGKWREECHAKDEAERKAKLAKVERQRKREELRRKRRSGEITEDEFWKLMDENGVI